MMLPFEIAAGSVIGAHHLRSGKNNQDAYSYQASAERTIAIVCDGCGSCAHSEVGAKLGVRLVVEALKQADIGSETFWQTLNASLLEPLSQLAFQMGANLLQTVQDHLLFTIVGAVLTSDETVLFALGDGVVLLNGDHVEIPTVADNAPPYLAYGLIEPAPMPAERLQFQVLRRLPTEAVQSILLGTDGVQDMIAIADQNRPAKREPIGDISQFWQDDRYFKNPDQIRRTLALMNREVVQADWQNQQLHRQGGLLPDDTTFVVIRRRVC